jgi:membrane peptidoglycan carboxypeptidase
VRWYQRASLPRDRWWGTRTVRGRLAAPVVARARLLMAILGTHLWLPRPRSNGTAPESDVTVEVAAELAAEISPDPVLVWETPEPDEGLPAPERVPAPAPPIAVPAPRWIQVLRAARTFVVIVVVGGLAVGACLAAIIPGAELLATGHRFTPVNLEGRLSPLSQRTTVYDAAGNQMGVLAIEDRQPVDLEEVPQHVIDAIVATEDQTFWENPGIDVGGLFRAFVENASSGSIEQGGSTITQQLVKNRILDASRDLDRKVRELVLAYRLNEQYTKREILEEYLNTIYFGQGSYGIKSAAERFFRLVDPATGQERGKQLDELDIADAALLAGLIANPEGDNPFVYPERAAERRADSLDLQVEEGYLTQEEADLAKQAPLPTIRPPAERRPENYWVEEVQKRLLADERLGATEQERHDKILRGGLRVYSTIDPLAQWQAQVAVNEELARSGRAGFTASLVAIEPSTGFVRAMVAGPGFEESQYNLATSPPGQQAGSSWKIVTLATAFNQGYSPNDVVDGTQPCTIRSGEGYSDPGTTGRVTTRNAGDGAGSGRMTLRRATTGSVNCAFGRLAASIGYDTVIETARRLGIRQELGRFGEDGNWYPAHTPVLTLGVWESTALEMATVGATVANNGVRMDATFIERVEGPGGEIIFDERVREGEQAISAQAATCAVDVLKGVITGGTGTAARLAGPQEAAGKTGTTDGQVDANFLGFTPHIAAHVWYGSPVADISGAGFGGQVPARIWKGFMDQFHAGRPAVPFTPPGPNCNAPGGLVTDLGRDTSRPVTTAPPRPPAPAPLPPELFPAPPAPAPGAPAGPPGPPPVPPGQQ